MAKRLRTLPELADRIDITKCMLITAELVQCTEDPMYVAENADGTRTKMCVRHMAEARATTNAEMIVAIRLLDE